MNPFDPHASLPDWRRHLTGLPEVEPDESLWLRLQTAHAAGGRANRSAPRRYGWAWGVAAAMLMAVALVPLTRTTRTDSTVGEEVALQASPAAARAVVDAGLLQIDADIERAYAQGVGDAEIASLWATRQRVALSLDSAAPVLVARL